MSSESGHNTIPVPALRVHQWLEEWDRVKFSGTPPRRRPPQHFYLLSVDAATLKRLSGIQRRSIKEGTPRAQDLGIQRQHDRSRSEEIHEFIRYGYPWSELSKAKRDSEEYDDLRKPGWLPTAIVVNILEPNDERRGQRVSPDDLISVKDEDGSVAATIYLPSSAVDENWYPQALHPIEVIDGQHRLWAFENSPDASGFQLPVVAFYGLDISWQAYLFWTINIKPKKINASLAFDLYPLLRSEDWLDKFFGHSIYRETRSQELTSALWGHPSSPWYHRINMLGEKGQRQRMVSQAAWIRSLMATYVRPLEGKGNRTGGLFGPSETGSTNSLPWSGAQQAAFLIMIGRSMADAVRDCDEEWAIALRKLGRADGSVSEISNDSKDLDLAFTSQYSILNQDQGIRALLHITNDMCYMMAEYLKLSSWHVEIDSTATDIDAVSEALASLDREPVKAYIQELTFALANYDWQTSSTPGLPLDERRRRQAFRGSGGYRVLREDLLDHLASLDGQLSATARLVLEQLRD